MQIETGGRHWGEVLADVAGVAALALALWIHFVQRRDRLGWVVLRATSAVEPVDDYRMTPPVRKHVPYYDLVAFNKGDREVRLRNIRFETITRRSLPMIGPGELLTLGPGDRIARHAEFPGNPHWDRIWAKGWAFAAGWVLAEDQFDRTFRSGLLIWSWTGLR
jgi:hypothetical protein